MQTAIQKIVLKTRDALRRSQRSTDAYDVEIGHGSVFKPGTRWGKWEVDSDNWWRRLHHAGDAALLDRAGMNSFIEGKYIYVRSKQQAQRLDRGLRVE